MAQLDAFSFANTIRNRLVEFSLDRNFVRNPALSEICRSLWAGTAEAGGLVSELWVEGAFPAESSGETIHSLVEQKLFSDKLATILDHDVAVPRERSLYTHQHRAIVQAQKRDANNARPALVVTAGTGAGKTESFLLPILNDLFRGPAGGAGVKCLILYPMNALVNDQVDRLYQWLADQEEVTLFHFTSETPENKKRADEDGVREWEPCRKRTRQEARGLEDRDGRKIDPTDPALGIVPDILITNYSMLEYMLCRPQDAGFFGDGLRAVVLDEAHLYTGTLAAEITLLLRRLNDRCGVSADQILHIATSATIGREGAEGDLELQQFASTLFSKSPDLVQVIRGKSRRIEMAAPVPPPASPSVLQIAAQPWLDDATIEMAPDGSQALVTDAEFCDRLAKQLSLVVDGNVVAMAHRRNKDVPAKLLHETLASTPLIRQISDILWRDKRLPLKELARELWGEETTPAIQATIRLLQMGAAARPRLNEFPLVPHRLHLLTRPTDGLVVCLNEHCTGDANVKLPGLGCLHAGFSDHCLYCNHVTLSLLRCGNCGEVVLAGRWETQGSPRLWPVTGNEHHKKGTSLFVWAEPGEGSAGRYVIDPASGTLSNEERTGLAIYQISDCPNCKSEQQEAWQAFSATTPLTLSILTETALAALPEYAAAHRKWLPARGRRLLAFSDSRQEAARLGPRLTIQHETQVVRAALARVAVKSGPASNDTMADIKAEIAAYEQRLLQTDARPEQRQRWQKKLNELRQELNAHAVGGTLEEWRTSLEQEPILQEVIDSEIASKHEAADWPNLAEERWEENFEGVADRLRELIGRELASPLRRAVSIETLGLLEVTYPGLAELSTPNSLLGVLSTSEAEKLSQCWPDFLAALCDSLRTDGAITLGSQTLDSNYQFGNIFIGRWCTMESSRGRLLAFAGKTMKQRRRVFAGEILRRCGVSEERIEELSQAVLRAAFRQLHENAEGTLRWLKTQTCFVEGGMVDGVRIHFPELGLRRPLQLFQSQTTNYIFPRSVFGCAPEAGCTDLVPVDEEQLNRNPRYGRQRRELQNSPVFELALWAEEHSAQLSPKENRRLQDLFKLGVRNILSSTTTLELGIDIGGLNCVLMGNVPPGKANYLQRAGRAGRRADGSSVVLTYSRPRPFDRAVFHQFGDYLSRELRRPRVLLDRQRIVQRHCHAFFLGEFFQSIYPPGKRVGAMQAFGSMGGFCGATMPPRWQDAHTRPELRAPKTDLKLPVETPWWNSDHTIPGLEIHFLDFLQWVAECGEDLYHPRLAELGQATPLAHIENWKDWIDSIISSFDLAVADWREDYNSLLAAWKECETKSQANAIRYQLAALYDTTVIEALADRQFLPRYGFPIGLQKLQVIVPDENADRNDRVRIREEDQFRLERPGLLALREYVPGSQLLVGGKLVTSHGLRKHWTGAAVDNYIGLTGQYAECKNRHIFYAITGSLENCPICDAPKKSSAKRMLLPKHGFSSAAWDPPRRSTEVERVGTVERATITFNKYAGEADVTCEDFAGIENLRAQYREAGELLVFNSGAIWEEDENSILRLVSRGCGFAICLKCGYADSELKNGNGQMDLPAGFSKHAPLTSTNPNSYCWKGTEAPVLRNQTLAAREITDVLMLSFEGSLQPLARNEAFMRTLAQALQIAGARMLELDTREIGVMLTGTGAQANEWGAVLYDNVPGGAGHVRGLLDLGQDWLKGALEVLYLNESHHQRCETACLDCLLTFDAQEALEKGLLRRRETYETLLPLLSDQTQFPNPTPTPQIEEPTTNERPTNEERLARGRQRIRGRS